MCPVRREQGESRARRLGARCSLVSAAIVFAWCIGAPAAIAQDSPDDPGAQEFQAVCSKCHPPDRIVAARRTKTEWEETLEKMAKLGAPITDDNYDILMSFLVHHHGKVNVNRSAPADIADVVGLTEDEAQTIVKYREENGPFVDFESLVKIPGVDAKKLEKNRDALTF